ncbi:MAG: DUF3127 domain-containing protein [Saprospiraceae bacterium]|nr:DUF3127 domain-containing protein [Saprospiraceae bacterium]
MAFEVEGKLYRKFDTEQKSSSFQAREFVLEVPDGNYPQLIKFQLVQDRCNLLDVFSEGDFLKVSFDLRGREWNGKYLTNLNAWKLDRSAGEQQQAPPAGGQAFPPDPFPRNDGDAPAPQNVDDLPF